VTSLLSGGTIVPFFLLGFSAFSPSLIELALNAKGAMMLAGCVGFVFVFAETVSPKNLRKRVAPGEKPEAETEI
jgi:hypothetical protein